MYIERERFVILQVCMYVYACVYTFVDICLYIYITQSRDSADIFTTHCSGRHGRRSSAGRRRGASHHQDGHRAKSGVAGTNFTCFYGTKVQVLTQKVEWQLERAKAASVFVLLCQ